MSDVSEVDKNGETQHTFVTWKMSIERLSSEMGGKRIEAELESGCPVLGGGRKGPGR